MASILQDVNYQHISGFRNKDTPKKKLLCLSNYFVIMHIFCINMLRMGEYRLPSLFTVSGYKVYFWSNESGEPIHVHVSKGKPTPNGTKIWLTKTGGCILASNGSHIPKKELNELMEFISAQFFLICAEWKKFFVTEDVKFYC